MEETEVPTEHMQEEMQHHAGHASSESRWVNQVALSSALFAVLAAVASLLSGHHINEAMIEQLRASDHWSQYQAKSIKAVELQTRISFLKAVHGEVAVADTDKIKEYSDEQKDISKDAKNEELSSKAHQASHEVFACAVTFSQIAIAICAISVLTRRRRFWYMGLLAGVVGTVFLVQGLLLH